MLRRVLILLAAPTFALAAQVPSGGHIEIPVSADEVMLSLSSDGYEIVAQPQTTPVAGRPPGGQLRPLRGIGSLSYALGAERQVRINAIAPADTIRVEISDRGRTVAFITGHSVILRRHGDLLSLDVLADGAAVRPTRAPEGSGVRR